NGIKDGTETFASNYLVESSRSGLVKAGTTDKNGNFLNEVETGTYTTSVKPANNYYTVNPANKQSVFATLNSKDSFDFALVPIPGKKDLKLVLHGLSILRPGFGSHYRIDYSNPGTETIANVKVRFIKPSNMDFD